MINKKKKEDMKILLVKPRYHEVHYKKMWSSKMPPLGILYIASVLLKNDFKVKVLDMEALGYDTDQLREYLLKEKPDVVGVSTTTPIIKNTIECIRTIRMVLTEAVIVVGGPHVTLEPEHSLKTMLELNFILRGEAEHTFLELVQCLAEARGIDEIKKIPGIGFLRENGTFISKKTPLIENLDKLPFPAFELVDMTRYGDSLSFKKKTFMMMASRGCPYACTFCSEPLLYGHKFRARSPENVVEEIETLVKRCGIKHIVFSDSTFNYNMERVEQICDLIIEKQLRFEWRIKARVDYVNKKMLKKLKQANCRIISYGVESAQQESLNLLQKAFTIEQVKSAFKLTKEAGIEILGYFILGLPNETNKQLKNTISFAKKLNPDYVTFTMATPWPKTRFTESVSNHIITKDWSEFWQKNCVTDFPQISNKEIQKQYNEAFLSFYMRPSYIINRLTKIRSPKEFLINIQQFFTFFCNRDISKRYECI